MSAEPVPQNRGRIASDAGVLRYYHLAKHAEWQVRDLPWGEIPPVPEYKGSPKKLARRWTSGDPS